MRIIRQQFYAKADKEILSYQFEKQFLKLGLLKKNSIIAGYWPYGSEVPIGSLLKTLHQLGYPVVLPVMTDPAKRLTFRLWTPESILETDLMGIKCPSEDQPCLQPTLLLVPLLAFNKKGERLGQGGGFYDKTIQALRQVDASLLTIGMAYEVQKVNNLWIEPHDEYLDYIVTENTIYQFPER